MTVDRDRLARIILAGSSNDIQEWRLGDPALAAAKGYPREYPAPVVDDFGILFIDITLDAATGGIVCHEVNGPNAVGSDAITGDSRLRAENEARQAVRRAREMGYLTREGGFDQQVVAVHAHQHWPFFRTGGEFYPRVAAFADALEGLLPGQPVECYAAADELGNEAVAVVMGDVPSIGAHLGVDAQTGRFTYRGRPVVFIGNPNLLPELIRTGKLAREDRTPANPALRVLHAWRFAELIHDKGRQQEFFDLTAIRPLRHFSADTFDEAVGKCRAMLDHGPVVIKPSDTSGGAGVNVVVPGMDEAELRARFETLLADCRAKYGDNTDAMVFPIRGFEFVRSTGFPMEDGEHLWDLRIAVLFEPGKAQCYPVTLRLTPEAFDPASFHTDKRQWISNVSGRRETLLKSGMDDAVLAAVGLSDEVIEQAMQSCVKWTQKAWDTLARDGGISGTVFEDSRESADSPFYRGEKFAV